MAKPGPFLDILIVFINLTELLFLVRKHVRKTKNLTPTDRTLVSLCLADILVGVSGIIFDLRRQLFFPKSTASTIVQFIYVFVLQYSVISSLLNLGLITVERMVSVSRPIAYRMIFTPTRVVLMITAIWILTFSITPAIVWASLRFYLKLDNYLVAVLTVACSVLLIIGYIKTYLTLRKSRLRLLQLRNMGSSFTDSANTSKKHIWRTRIFRSPRISSTTVEDTSGSRESSSYPSDVSKQFEVHPDEATDICEGKTGKEIENLEEAPRQATRSTDLRYLIVKECSTTSPEDDVSPNKKYISKVASVQFGKESASKNGNQGEETLNGIHVESKDKEHLGRTISIGKSGISITAAKSNTGHTSEGNGSSFIKKDQNVSQNGAVNKELEESGICDASKGKSEAKSKQNKPDIARKTKLWVQNSVIDRQNEFRLKQEREFLFLGMNISVAFIVCFIPYAIYSAIFDYTAKRAKQFLVFYILARCNSLINPLVYLVFVWRSKHQMQI